MEMSKFSTTWPRRAAGSSPCASSMAAAAPAAPAPVALPPPPGPGGPEPDRLRIDPDPGMRPQLTALAKEPWRPVRVDTSFTRELGEPEEPYERLLHAAIAGDRGFSPGRAA